MSHSSRQVDSQQLNYETKIKRTRAINQIWPWKLIKKAEQPVYLL